MLFANATILSPSPMVGDLLVDGAEIAAVGPGPHSGGVTEVDCTGLMIVPLFDGPLVPGNPATFAVVPATAGPFHRIIWWPSQATMILSEGRVVTDYEPAPPPADSPYLGMWIDTTGFLYQELTADGRYDETRGGRRHAYQGGFRIDGDHITYRDDQGFWAYGLFDSGVLKHAEYRLQPALAR